jgi:hypothetical protein
MVYATTGGAYPGNFFSNAKMDSAVFEAGKKRQVTFLGCLSELERRNRIDTPFQQSET